MKKIILLGIFVCSLAFQSCTKDENLVNFEAIKLTGYSKINEDSKFPFRIFTVTLHRASQDCKSGGGFCDFEWFPDCSVKPNDINSEKANVIVYYENNEAFFNVYVATPIDGNISLDNFTYFIDEEIRKTLIVDGQKVDILINAGKCNYNPTIGEFGGFNVPIKIK
jgi:hypothetical protein